MKTESWPWVGVVMWDVLKASAMAIIDLKVEEEQKYFSSEAIHAPEARGTHARSRATLEMCAFIYIVFYIMDNITNAAPIRSDAGDEALAVEHCLSSSA